MNRRQIIFLILSIVCMAVIFIFSSKDGNESTEDSYEVGLLFGRIFLPGFDEKSEEEQLEFAEKIDYPVRKLAHATEYAILAMLICGVMAGMLQKNSLEFLIAWIGATIYAVTDELHQLFVPGRSGKLSDVLIDSGGALLGILFLALVMFLAGRRKKQIICS